MDARRLVALSDGEEATTATGERPPSARHRPLPEASDTRVRPETEQVIPTPSERPVIPLVLTALAALFLVGAGAVALLTRDGAVGETESATSSTLGTGGSSSAPPAPTSTTVTQPTPTTATTPKASTTTTLPPAPLGMATVEEAVYEAFGVGSATIRRCPDSLIHDYPCHDDAGTAVPTGAKEGETVLLFTLAVTAWPPENFWVLVKEQVDGSFLAVETVPEEGEFDWPNSPWAQ